MIHPEQKHSQENINASSSLIQLLFKIINPENFNLEEISENFHNHQENPKTYSHQN